MTRLSVNQAARAGYASRAAIYRKVKERVLHSEAGTKGETVIDTAELTRVFGEPAPQPETSPKALIDVSETAHLRAENALLRAENADLRLQRDRLMRLLEQASVPCPQEPRLTLRRRALPPDCARRTCTHTR